MDVAWCSYIIISYLPTHGIAGAHEDPLLNPFSYNHFITMSWKFWILLSAADFRCFINQEDQMLSFLITCWKTKPWRIGARLRKAKSAAMMHLARRDTRRHRKWRKGKHIDAHDPPWLQRIETEMSEMSLIRNAPLQTLVHFKADPSLCWSIWGDVAVGEPSQQFHPLQFCLGYCGLCKCLSVSCRKAFYTTHCMLIYVHAVSPTVLKAMHNVYVWISYRYRDCVCSVECHPKS